MSFNPTIRQPTPGSPGRTIIPEAVRGNPRLHASGTTDPVQGEMEALQRKLKVRSGTVMSNRIHIVAKQRDLTKQLAILI